MQSVPFVTHKILKPNLNQIAIGIFADEIFLPKVEKEEANFGNNLLLNIFVHKVIREKGGPEGQNGTSLIRVMR